MSEITATAADATRAVGLLNTLAENIENAVRNLENARLAVDAVQATFAQIRELLTPDHAAAHIVTGAAGLGAPEIVVMTEADPDLGEGSAEVIERWLLDTDEIHPGPMQEVIEDQLRGHGWEPVSEWQPTREGGYWIVSVQRKATT